MSKKSSYFKSKKGFSLIELLCAVVIMAIVVSATATGLAVSYKSIMIGSVQDKASAKAQEYCDVIMTYVQVTPSHDPTVGIYDAPENNMLFKLSEGDDCIVNFPDPSNPTDTTPDILGQIRNATEPNMVQLADTSLVSSHKNDDEPYFVIKKNGEYDNNGTTYVSYQITVYVDYGNGDYTTSCTGSVTKPQIHVIPT